jgi:hypothetical protein
LERVIYGIRPRHLKLKKWDSARRVELFDYIHQDNLKLEAQNNRGPNEADTRYTMKIRTKTTKTKKKKQMKKRNPRTKPHS